MVALRAESPLRRGPLGALIFVAVSAGCPGVAIRPDGSPAEEDCPEGAREAMEARRLKPGASLVVHVDAAKPSPGKLTPLIVYDGPIESETRLPVAELPGHTRLQGRIWTGGPRVVIRYYSARLPDGKLIPFCAVAADNGPGLPKSPGRPGSAALEDSSAFVFVTGQFR